MKTGWMFRRSDRMILHRAGQNAPSLPIGAVPKVLGKITYRDADRRHTKVAYLIETEEGARIVQAHQILDGTWADVVGCDRPVSRDECQAYAKVMAMDLREAPEMPSIPVKDADGGLVLPGPESQDLGYMRTGDPDEEAALAAWRRIATLAMAAPRTTLGLSAFFAAPLTSSLRSIHTHVLVLYGSGQKGKSTLQKVQAGSMGNPGETYKIFGALNTTANALPEYLIQARYLPMTREELSSGGWGLKEIQAMVSRILGGARRDRLDQSGGLRSSIGTFRSMLCVSANESLLVPGQPESFASRVIELHEPFFSSADASDEAVALSEQYHGWPLVWADRAGMFSGKRIQEWRQLHDQITKRLSTADSGIPFTLARTMSQWVVGGYMLGELLGLPQMGEVAFEDARRELPRVTDNAAVNNVSPGQRVWELVAGAIAMHPAMWLTEHVLTSDAEADQYTPRDVLGYWYKNTKTDRTELHVYGEALKRMGLEAGVVLAPGLGELKRRDILRVTQSAGFKSKPPTRKLRDRVRDMVYIIDVDAGRDAWDPAEGSVVPDVPPAPADDSPIARAERAAIERAANLTPPAPAGGDVTDSRAHDVTSEAPALVVEPKAVPETFTAYPQPVAEVTDQEWENLAAKARSNRTRDALRIGVLGADGLHLPNCRPIPGVRRPASVNDVPELMAAYGLKTLYLHGDMLPVLGLPEFDPRKEGGPQAPTACEWGEPGEAIAKMRPAAGVSCWMTLTTPEGKRLNLAIPAYEGRFDKLGLPGRGGFGGPETAAVLLDALMVYLVSTVHGPADNPAVIPYYLSPNKTAEDFAGGLDRDDVVSGVIREMAKKDDHHGDGPKRFQRWSGPLAEPISTRTMVSPQWARVPNLAEETDEFLHKFDRVAAWLPAFNSVVLGIGDPTHYAGGRAYDPLKAGIWRVATVPPVREGVFEGLPTLVFKEASAGGYWLVNPDFDLLAEYWPEWAAGVEILEAWVWETSKRALTGMYKKLLNMRRHVLRCQEEGRPGARWVKGIHGRLYQSFRGYLGRNDPRYDHETGDVYERDIYWRPDWAKAIMALANANTFRALHKYAERNGRFPLSLYVDAVTYTSEHADPAMAKPGEMKLGTTSGTWSSEGVIPLAAVLDRLKTSSDPEGDNAHTVMREYLAEQKKQEG
ncbi:DUF927 domain-containing protein [Streptomyces sp. A1547]|uniref:DUF927 domain-containing protein n=1 Tax=Streptomyces sp. A1547 TaxID=2563105 RepID=UPI00109ED1BB|nr:DUF927 domain-containing protein [Streptomyces sp. A1547]THA28467.1 DUF927 domain-containing protein [Streptomyces sp. A1547]